jgi:NADPH-dependent 2,4-dienoyl-CoA reductase/sulfur reductase-like enzyme
MYVYARQLRLVDTEPYERDLYARERFVRVVARATALDPATRAVVLESGDRVPYDALLLAVGSRSRRLPFASDPADRDGVTGFVTLRDLEALERLSARPGARAVVAGGGLIGAECAEILHHRRIPVTWLVRDGAVQPAALDAEESAVVAARARALGIDARLGRSAVGARRAGGALRGVVLDDGDVVDASLIVEAIGVEPATEWLASSGVLRTDTGGLVTDDTLATSIRGVWAAGDCAAVPTRDGALRVETLWYTARDQGRVAGDNLLGAGRTYRRTAWYNAAKLFDVEYTTAGRIPLAGSAEERAATVWFQRGPAPGATLRVVCDGARVVGFNALGARWDHTLWMRWIAERRTLDEVLERLPEASFDEEGAVRFRVLPSSVRREGTTCRSD